MNTNQAPMTACKGMNCGCTDGVSHSLECQAEHAAAIAGGVFVKPTTPPTFTTLPLPPGASFYSDGVQQIMATVSELHAWGQRCYEFAMRKAQEGREPVAFVPVAKVSDLILDVRQRVMQHGPVWENDLYLARTSPPPNSDEARDALKALISAVDAEIADEWECTSYHPSLRPALEHARAALAAQQKGGV